MVSLRGRVELRQNLKQGPEVLNLYLVMERKALSWWLAAR